MTTLLDNDSRDALISYRLQRSADTIAEAEYNAQGQYFNAAVNRLYYACYYAASALMLHYRLEASTHAGIKSMLGLHFIRPGILDNRYGRIYQQLFENRQSGDYEDFVYCDQELYETLRPMAVDFVDRLKQLICSSNHRTE